MKTKWGKNQLQVPSNEILYFFKVLTAIAQSHQEKKRVPTSGVQNRHLNSHNFEYKIS